MRPLAFLPVFLSLSACAETRLGEPVEVGFQPYVGRFVTVSGSVDGHALSPMLFDTGGGFTLVTPEHGETIGCEPQQSVTGRRMSGEPVTFALCGAYELDLAGQTLSTPLVVFDLNALLPDEFPPLAGLVSLSSFAEQPFTLDLSGRRLVLETPESLQARTAALPGASLRTVLSVEHGDPDGSLDAFAPVRLDGRGEPAWFLIDSANLDAVIIDPETARNFGLSFEDPAILSGEETFAVHLQIGAAAPVEVEARLRDIIYDGAINEATLRRFEVTFDLSAPRIWLRPVEPAR